MARDKEAMSHAISRVGVSLVFVACFEETPGFEPAVGVAGGDKPVVATGGQPVVNQVLTQRQDDRPAALASAALGVDLVGCEPRPWRTRIEPSAGSTSCQHSAIDSPRRRPAYSAVAQTARSHSGGASISASASAGVTWRSARAAC
jgi:hypothetical protein